MVNPLLKLSKKSRLAIAIAISSCFFIVEISVGFYTHSLALIADAFHVLFDLLSFSLALGALTVSEGEASKYRSLSFGWQRAQLLGSFFNGVFQLALGFSIFLLSIERFISVLEIQNPKLMLIVACAGLASNIISGTFLGVHEHSHHHGSGNLNLELLAQHHELGHRHHIKAEKQSWWQKLTSHDHHHHEHDGHDHGHHNHAHDHAHDHDHDHEHGHGHHGQKKRTRKHHDLGTKAVLIHVLGDAFNNLGVIIAAAVIWKTHFKARFYADPAASMGIGLVLIVTALKLVWQGGQILLQSAPIGVDVEDVKHDLEKVPGVLSVHELHVWRLNEEKACASAHVVIADASLEHFEGIAKIINECLHAYGIHSATIQPEVTTMVYSSATSEAGSATQRLVRSSSGCELHCGANCEVKSCCG